MARYESNALHSMVLLLGVTAVFGITPKNASLLAPPPSSSIAGGTDPLEDPCSIVSGLHAFPNSTWFQAVAAIVFNETNVGAPPPKQFTMFVPTDEAVVKFTHALGLTATGGPGGLPYVLGIERLISLMLYHLLPYGALPLPTLLEQSPWLTALGLSNNASSLEIAKEAPVSAYDTGCRVVSPGSWSGIGQNGTVVYSKQCNSVLYQTDFFLVPADSASGISETSYDSLAALFFGLSQFDPSKGPAAAPGVAHSPGPSVSLAPSLSGQPSGNGAAPAPAPSIQLPAGGQASEPIGYFAVNQGAFEVDTDSEFALGGGGSVAVGNGTESSGTGVSSIDDGSGTGSSPRLRAPSPPPRGSASGSRKLMARS